MIPKKPAKALFAALQRRFNVDNCTKTVDNLPLAVDNILIFVEKIVQKTWIKSSILWID